MHYFHNLWSASGGFTSRPPLGLHPWTPLGTFVFRPLICPQTPNLPTPGNNPAGAHAATGNMTKTTVHCVSKNTRHFLTDCNSVIRPSTFIISGTISYLLTEYEYISVTGFYLCNFAITLRHIRITTLQTSSALFVNMVFIDEGQDFDKKICIITFFSAGRSLLMLHFVHHLFGNLFINSSAQSVAHR